MTKGAAGLFYPPSLLKESTESLISCRAAMEPPSRALGRALCCRGPGSTEPRLQWVGGGRAVRSAPARSSISTGS